MKTKTSKLPPTWVKVFSCLFLIFLIFPLFVAWQVFETGSQYGISAFGLDLEGGQDPLAWMLAVDAVLFMAALTGLFIVTRRSFAYDFGIFYCAATFTVTIPANFYVGDWDGVAWSNIGVQYPLLFCFLVHLIRNRAQWKDQNANKAVLDNRLHAPSLNDHVNYNP
jgi:hypothetical protein